MLHEIINPYLAVDHASFDGSSMVALFDIGIDNKPIYYANFDGCT